MSPILATPQARPSTNTYCSLYDTGYSYMYSRRGNAFFSRDPRKAPPELPVVAASAETEASTHGSSELRSWCQVVPCQQLLLRSYTAVRTR
jgi:hypothetical protein